MSQLIRATTICFLLALVATGAHAESIAFRAAPHRVYEGDAIQFLYLESTDTIRLTNVVRSAWDFDGDGNPDELRSWPVRIDTTWFAVLDPARATNGVAAYRPVLTLVTTNHGLGTLTTNVQQGVTEDVVGFDGTPDPDIFVISRAAGNQDIRLSFSATPRLATNGTVVRFYADPSLLVTGRVERLEWDFGDGSTALGSNPSHLYSLPPGTDSSLFNVSLTATYSVVGPPARTNTLTRAVEGFIRVIDFTPASLELALGRAYRRGFPQEYGWDDIIKAYQAVGFDGLGRADSYVYYHHLETAYHKLVEETGPKGNRQPTAAQREKLAEIINELVQGQNLIANQRLIEALRMRYPRVGGDPDNPPDRLPEPPHVRTNLVALEVALLDFQAPLTYPLQAIQEFGPGILRSRAAPGTEPFPDFPRYLSFLDPTLSQQPVPIKNEYWQLTAHLDKMSLGTMEKAKRLFRLSLADPTAREEAKEEAKRAGMQGYLGMAVLAAGQSEADFALNQGNSLLAHVKNARDLFEQINAGLNPLGNDGSFIPNESFVATYQDAQEAVADARESEIRAREEDRTYDRFQADLRNELQSQRAQFITPLRNLTGIDPVLYNNLATVDDQVDYRNTIRQRVDALIASYPDANPAGLGEYGAQVISIIDAGQAIRQSINRLKNLYAAIDIEAWANAEIDLINDTATRKLKVSTIARGFANAWEESTGSDGRNLTFKIGTIISGFLEANELDIRRIQNARISDIQLEATIRQRLLEVANLNLDIVRARNRLDQERLRLDNMLSLMDRYIEDLANARDTAATLYFQDPSFRVVVSQAQRRADAELDFAIDRLYRLAKTLEYEWTEAYQNPLIIPVLAQEPASLENPLFDKFIELDSLFITRTADEAKDYLDALRAWDSKLRRINVTSVRGPNHAAPLTAEPISVREQVLGLRVEGTNTLANSVQQFRAFLSQRRQPTFFNPGNPLLEFEFSTSIADNSYFPATGSRWNMRIHTISIDLIADQGFSPKQVAEVDLLESGMVTLRRFFAEPPFADDLFNLTFNLGRAERSAFGIVVPSRINGATGGRPIGEFQSAGLLGRPIAATRWVFRIDTSNPSNRDIDFNKLKDIVIRFTYTYGNPPEFPGF